MKRLRWSAALVVVTAMVAFAPLGAQNTARRAMGLEDILSFRAMGLTSLSPNGQWIAYRLSPLEGDSEVVIRATSGDKVMKFPVGQNGGAVSFSSDSAWATVTKSRP